MACGRPDPRLLSKCWGQMHFPPPDSTSALQLWCVCHMWCGSGPWWLGESGAWYPGGILVGSGEAWVGSSQVFLCNLTQLFSLQLSLVKSRNQPLGLQQGANKVSSFSTSLSQTGKEYVFRVVCVCFAKQKWNHLKRTMFISTYQNAWAVLIPCSWEDTQTGLWYFH